MKKTLPVFALEIDENNDSDLEVNYVAMVDKPAIEADFFAFNDAPVRLHFSGDDERVIIGPAMIPDKPIYRNEPDLGEFYVQFTKETIEQAAIKFFEKGYQRNINLMHSPEFQLEGVTIFQSFIKDSAKGIQGMGDDYPDGTWFLGAKVKNEDAWNLVKAGKVKGWSVEGLFRYNKKKLDIEETFERLRELLAQID